MILLADRLEIPFADGGHAWRASGFWGGARARPGPGIIRDRAPHGRFFGPVSTVARRICRCSRGTSPSALGFALRCRLTGIPGALAALKHADLTGSLGLETNSTMAPLPLLQPARRPQHTHKGPDHRPDFAQVRAASRRIRTFFCLCPAGRRSDLTNRLPSLSITTSRAAPLRRLSYGDLSLSSSSYKSA